MAILAQIHTGEGGKTVTQRAVVAGAKLVLPQGAQVSFIDAATGKPMAHRTLRKGKAEDLLVLDADGHPTQITVEHADLALPQTSALAQAAMGDLSAGLQGDLTSANLTSANLTSASLAAAPATAAATGGLFAGTSPAVLYGVLGAVGIGGIVAATSGGNKDTTAPDAPTALDLAAADDTGTLATDNLTRATSALTISGTAEANATVELFDGTTSLGTTTANASGVFTKDVALTAGTHAITAKATDGAGNVGPASVALTITVDTTAPVIPSALDLAAADDSGISASDNITDQTSALTISGTAEANGTIELFDGTTSLGTVTANGAGVFTKDVTLASGSHDITAKSVDAAGNISAASPALQISVSAAPQLLNSSIDGLGNVLKLYFSEVLDPATIPAASQFTVTNGTAQTVTGVQVVDNQVILTLAAPLSAAQSVTVGFAGGTNGLQDVAGNDVAAISGANVTNWLSQVQSQATNFAASGQITLAGAEISAFDATSDRLFVTSASGLQVVKINADLSMTLQGTISLGSNAINSVAVKNGIVAVAVDAANKTDPGSVFLLNAGGTLGDPAMLLKTITVGAVPDMVVFTADGQKLLVANEGEQDVAGVNPAGSVSIINLAGGAAAATVTTATFEAFNAKAADLRAAGVRLFAGQTGFETITVAQDLEPEYIAISPDGTTAMVTLQENNAIGVLDLATGQFTDIVPLGTKSFLGLPFDGTDRDGAGGTAAINLQTTSPVFGQYMPDAIASFTGADGKAYYVIANEGDDRDDFITPDETARLSAVNLDDARFPNEVALKANTALGRLTISNAPGNKGDTDGDGDIDKILAYGARSFSILNEDGVLVFDSGSHIEQFVAARGMFTDGAGTGLFDDTRSDNKSAEPEGITIGQVGDSLLAFVALERGGGGVMVYDVTNPADVTFVQYLRNFGDISPEGLLYVKAADSPNGQPLLIVSNEVSFTVSIFGDASAMPITAEAAFPAEFLVGINDQAAFRSVMTVGQSADNGYVLDGILDGVGIADMGNGTLKVLVNHEMGATAGAVRAHGSKGAYVSELIVDKATLNVISGQDFLQSASALYLWDNAAANWTSGMTTAFNRFCSGDLAAQSAFRSATSGYQGQIYLTGEESGAEGRAFAHIVSGSEAGRVYELAALGNMSFENAVANPLAQGKTVVALTDDATANGQVYFYIGNKSNLGNAVQQAGLAGGGLFGVKIGTSAGAATEVGVLANAAETGLGLVGGQAAFSLVSLGDASRKTGAQINTDSIAEGVTNFLRPEDGAWSLNGRSFYFVTTASPTTASRLWALDFTDPTNPEAGGTVRLLLDGSEGQMMLDNITVANDGTLILQEDPGNNARLAKIWKYDPASDALTAIAQHDPEQFSGATAITLDEESSGVVDVTAYFVGVTGYDTTKFNYFMVADQVHKGIANPVNLVEMGALTLMATPKTTADPDLAIPVINDSYLVGTAGRSVFNPIINAGEKAGNGYQFNGIPDGMGVVDLGDGTFRLVVNHEIAAGSGVVRAHGSNGAYLSDLIIDKATLTVLSGQDFLQSASNLYLWNGTGWTSGTTTAFNRFCSGDLAADTAYHTATTGYNGRIYLTGEEAGAEGRAFAHVLTGSEAGRVYELGALGNLSFENLVANSFAQTKTVVAATDDTATNGQVYFYIGDKAATGNAVEMAGLSGGHMFGVKVGAAAATEVGALANPTETGLGLVAGQAVFSLVDLGDVSAKTGAQLNTDSIAAGVTNFLRPEDGAWSLDGDSFYFVTTASPTTASRLWMLDFTDKSNPALGGKIKLLLDGSEGQMMFDNLTVSNTGRIIIQEDPGNNARSAKIWSYDVASDALVEIAQHDPARFTGTGALTQDEESSGIIDVSALFAGVGGYDTDANSYFLVADQIHAALASPAGAVEYAQLNLMATSMAYA